MITKIRRSLLSAVLVVGIALTMSPAAAVAQTNDAPKIAPVTLPVPPSFLSLDFITNLPTATNFQSATLGLNIGALAKNGGVENLLKVDYYIHTNWMVSGETFISPSSTVIDAFSLYGGYRIAWDNAEIYAQGLARRTFTTDAVGTRPSYQGGGLFGAAWLPMTGGKLMIFADSEITTAQHGNAFDERPEFGVRAGIKVLFRAGSK